MIIIPCKFGSEIIDHQYDQWRKWMGMNTIGDFFYSNVLRLISLSADLWPHC